MRTPSGVVLPDRVAMNMERERAVDRQLGLWRIYDRLAKDVDRRLSLIWVRDDCPPEAIYGGMVPGRWHFHRDNSETGTPDSFIPVVTEDGGFREPVASDIDRLREMDLWNPDVARRVREKHIRREAAKEREKANAKEERIDHGVQVLKALESPGVSFSDVPWTNKVKGRKRG